MNASIPPLGNDRSGSGYFHSMLQFSYRYGRGYFQATIALNDSVCDGIFLP
jgi:hypothetical protein